MLGLSAAVCELSDISKINGSEVSCFTGERDFLLCQAVFEEEKRELIN